MTGSLLKFLGIALGAHLVLLLFGGLLFLKNDKKEASKAVVEAVDIVGPDDSQDDKSEEPETKEAADEVSEQPEAPPDAEELIKTQTASAATPGLDALSLSALESVLSGAAASLGGNDDFGGGVSLQSGGVIGGTGRAGPRDENSLDAAFSLADLDQKPRPLFQAAPTYPQELRAKKVEGVVYVLFLVDPTGKVVNPKVEKSSHEAFARPALEAIKQWKFEPAIKNGQKVQCKMRVPIRFSAS